MTTPVTDEQIAAISGAIEVQTVNELNRHYCRTLLQAIAERDASIQRQLAAVTAERDAFTAALSRVRAERSEIKAITSRARQWITDSEVNTLLHYISDLERTEAAWRSARDAWLAETAARDERIQRLTQALREIKSSKSEVMEINHAIAVAVASEALEGI